MAFIKPGEMHKRIEGDIILWKRVMTDFIQRLAQIADVGKTGVLDWVRQLKMLSEGQVRKWQIPLRHSGL